MSDSSGGNDTHGDPRLGGRTQSHRHASLKERDPRRTEHTTPIIEEVSRKRQKQSSHQLNHDMSNAIEPYIYKGTGDVPSDVVHFKINACITTIGRFAFSGCTGITELSIPSSVTTIGERAFSGCTGITELSIPSSVTTIKEYAFQGCNGITKLSIPSSITTIGIGAFQDCGIIELSIPSSITTIKEYAFRGCTGVTELSIPSSITTIKEYAFEGCTGIVAIYLPENLTAISTSAFKGCYKLSIVNQQHSNNPGAFETFLNQAGFSPIKQDANLFDQSIYKSNREPVYYNIKKLVRTRNLDGRLPLFTAAANSLVWAEMKEFFAANMTVLHEVDNLTGLPLFMLAAVDKSSDLESVYNLLVEYPSAISL